MATQIQTITSHQWKMIIYLRKPAWNASQGNRTNGIKIFFVWMCHFANDGASHPNCLTRKLSLRGGIRVSTHLTTQLTAHLESFERKLRHIAVAPCAGTLAFGLVIEEHLGGLWAMWTRWVRLWRDGYIWRLRGEPSVCVESSECGGLAGMQGQWHSYHEDEC